jgi:hypothetical protein
LACTALFVFGSALAAAPSQPVLDAWGQMNHASIRVTTSDNGDFQQFDLDIAPNGDLRAHVKNREHGRTTQNTLLRIGHGALLVKGEPLEHGTEVGAADNPDMVLQTVTQLLAASGTPPSDVHGKIALDRHEDQWDIKIATEAAEAEYPAPWTLRGSVEAKPDGAIAFDLAHAFQTEETPVTVRYRGQLQHSAAATMFDDAMPLDGWQVFTVDGEFNATPLKPVPKTLGELRRRLKTPQ